MHTVFHWQLKQRSNTTHPHSHRKFTSTSTSAVHAGCVRRRQTTIVSPTSVYNSICVSLFLTFKCSLLPNAFLSAHVHTVTAATLCVTVSSFPGAAQGQRCIFVSLAFLHFSALLFVESLASLASRLHASHFFASLSLGFAPLALTPARCRHTAQPEEAAEAGRICMC